MGRKIRLRLRALFQPDDICDEVELHIEQLADEFAAQGMTPREAKLAAMRQFGNGTLLRESCREVWVIRWLETVLQDLRYALRGLRKNPGFAAVALLTLALGIGATTAVFSIVEAVLLRPLPYPHQERLVRPVEIDNGLSISVMPDFWYAAWREQASALEGIAAYRSIQFIFTGSGVAELLDVKQVTPGFFKVLGVAPAMGRDFDVHDAAPGGGYVAILGHRFWKRRLGGDPAILEKRVMFSGKPYSVAGVLPAGFQFPGDPDVDLLAPMAEPEGQPGHNPVYYYQTIARLNPGVTKAGAEAGLALIDKRLELAHPKSLRGRRTRLMSLHDQIVGKVRPALLILSGAVALVMLIVVVNVCNLLLGRAVARRKEIAVRIALGASCGRVLRQLLTEGMLLAVSGGVAGLALALAGIRLLRAIAPPGVPFIENAHINGAVLAFSFSMAAGAGILFGLAPLRGASGITPETALKQSSGAVTGTRGQRRLENLFTVAEVALALILVTGAGLLIRTFAGLMAIPPGFRPENVYTVRLTMPPWRYSSTERRMTLVNALLEKVRRGPGVDSAGAVTCLPYSGSAMTSFLEVEGHAAPQHNDVSVNFVAGDYFKAMGIPVLEGRAIDRSDTTVHPPVAVITDALERRFFPNGHAIGARLRAGWMTGSLEVVGVVKTVKQGGLASEPFPEIFQPAAQSEDGGTAQTLAVHSTADPRLIVPWLRAEIAAADKDVPPPEVRTMRSTMESLMSSQVFVMRILALFGAIAITLAAIGVYSVLLCYVGRRTRDMGIRSALGAKPVQVMGLVLGRGLRLSLVGTAIGVAGSLLLTKYLESLLYGVSPHDPATIAAGAACVIAMALGAAYVPARRAVRHDPVAILREE